MKLFTYFLTIAVVLLTHVIDAQNIQIASSSGSGIETGGRMTKDDHGNVYIFGTFTDTIKLSNTIWASSVGNFDCYLAKYNRYMQPLWIKTIGSSGLEGAGAISYFDGKLFLGGWYGAQTIINNDTLLYNLDCISPGFIVSIDTSGNYIHAKAFTKTANSINCFINDLEVNATGMVIAGKIKGQFDFGNNQYINTNLTGSEHDIFIARFDTAFTCNLTLTASSVLGLQRGDDGASSLQIDNIGNIYVAGFFGSLSGLGNATLYFGSQTAMATGGYGFADYFVAKIRPNGYVSWLRTSGGETPDFISQICLENDARLVMAGRYADNANVGGIPLTPSPGTYSSFIGTIDSAGTGISAFRVSNESLFQSLKKGADNYLYAADINNTSPVTRFKIYKIQSDTGIIALDSINILQAGNYAVGDILPPNVSCSEVVINCSFNEIVNFHNDTIIQNEFAQNLYDFFYGKYSMNSSLLGTPQINNLNSNTFCSNSSNILLSTNIIVNASDYHWQLIPTNAGSISNAGNSAILNIDSTFSGQIKIVCYVSNFCNLSDISDTLILNINQAPIIYSLADNGASAIVSDIINASNFNWYLNNSLLNFANMPIINCIGDGNYTIIANNANCSDTLSNFISCIVSKLDLLEENFLKIYPNPASSMVNLEFDSQALNEISLYDVTGKLILKTSHLGNKYALNTQDLSKGCYTIIIKSDNRETRSRLMIE